MFYLTSGMEKAGSEPGLSDSQVHSLSHALLSWSSSLSLLSVCDLRTSVIGITWELVGNVESQLYPRPTESEPAL